MKTERKKALVYCATGYGQRAAYSLNEEEYQVIAFIDRNPESPKAYGGGQRYVCGLPVFPPERIPELDFDLIVIGVSKYEEEITRILTETCHVSPDKIVTYDWESRYGGNFWHEERIIELKKCMEVLKERGIPGDMAEVGVYQGEFCKFFNRYFPERRLYLFDTFEGFDAQRNTVWDKDSTRFKDTSVELVLSKMERPQSCIVKKGYFPDTAVGVEGPFALVSLDVDLYEPMLAGLEFFYPRLSPGGYIFVHDYEYYRFPGVKKAILRFCDEYHVSFVPLLDRVSSVIFTK